MCINYYEAPTCINRERGKLFNCISEELFVVTICFNSSSRQLATATKQKLTSSVCIAQLPAHYSSIRSTPVVVTHCPPLVIDAHLHSTLILIGTSHQMNITINTVACSIDLNGVHYNEEMF